MIVKQTKKKKYYFFAEYRPVVLAHLIILEQYF